MSAIRAAACSLGLLLALFGLGTTTAVSAGAQPPQNRHDTRAESGAGTATTVGAARSWIAIVDRASSHGLLGPVVDRRAGPDANTPDAGHLADTAAPATMAGWAFVPNTGAEPDGIAAIRPASRGPPSLVA